VSSIGLPGHGVRPTKRCLEADLLVALPHVGIRLEDLDHGCVAAAQALPERHAANACERVAALTDRVWFKVKTSNHRGAATRLERGVVADADDDGTYHGQWWLGAAGYRKGDSAQDDFYDQLQADCERRKREANDAGANLKDSATTEHLLPSDWDARRLRAELGEHLRVAMKHHVREMAQLSLTSGNMITFEVNEYEVRVLIRADAGETYLAVGTRGISDARFFALLLDSFRPMIAPEDWLPEPSEAAIGIVPQDDEIVFSALLSPEAAGTLMDA
jgi:hypothetical protein